MDEKLKLTSWYEAYREIAVRLHEFQKQHEELGASVPHELFQLLNESSYSRKNKWFQRGIKKWDNNSMDPIQVFASFSHSKSNDKSRYENLNILLVLLGSPAVILPSDDFFLGCPTVMMSRLVTNRGLEFQKQTWAVFDSVMADGIEGLFQEMFYYYHSWYGINIVSFTIFLFWVNSDVFIPLDSSTRSFMERVGKWEAIPYDFEPYMDFCRSIPTPEIIKDIVKTGYQVSGEIRDALEFLPVTRDFLGLSEGDKIKLNHPFRIVAIQPTAKGGHCKNLKKNEIYQFYSDYKFVGGGDDEILYEENKSTLNLFRQKVLNIQISAIVGKNGSGKSTLSELLYLAINALARQHPKMSKDILPEELYVNVYFSTDRFYKLSVTGKVVKLHRYEQDNNDETRFELQKQNIIATFDFKSFFYSVGINYSIYGLNQKVIGDWIFQLFHKNDGYQIPVVLNPYRENGIIDPNSEEELARVRLLAHLLDASKFDSPDEVENDVEDSEEPNVDTHQTEDLLPIELVEGKRPNKLRVKFDRKKYESLLSDYDGFRFENRFDKDEDVAFVFGESGIIESIHNCLTPAVFKENKYSREIEKYIIFKLISIGATHAERYKDFIHVDSEKKIVTFFSAVYLYIEELLNESSHISFKIWQAINYLLHGHIDISEKGVETDIVQLASNVDKLRSNLRDEKYGPKGDILPKIEPIHFVPPSLFEVDILFEDGHRFKELSSGEKQSVFAINTVAYHLYNLDSIRLDSGLITYPFVNILLDEVELYFHPDMQRMFVFNLLKFLDGLNLENIRYVHIQFITHSPFILSDIPESNVLRIEDGNPEYTLQQETFGANVHDLLRNDFFLKHGFMGEFARERINDLIYFLTDSKENKPKINWDLTSAIAFIEMVGEPFLKSDLLELYKVKQKKELDSLQAIEAEISRLEKLRANFNTTTDDSDTYQ